MPLVDRHTYHAVVKPPVALTVAMTVSLLFAISRTRPHHLGLTAARWPANVVLGVALFLGVAPVALGVFFVVTLIGDIRAVNGHPAKGTYVGGTRVINTNPSPMADSGVAIADVTRTAMRERRTSCRSARCWRG